LKNKLHFFVKKVLKIYAGVYEVETPEQYKEEYED